MRSPLARRSEIVGNQQVQTRLRDSISSRERSRTIQTKAAPRWQLPPVGSNDGPAYCGGFHEQTAPDSPGAVSRQHCPRGHSWR